MMNSFCRILFALEALWWYCQIKIRLLFYSPSRWVILKFLGHKFCSEGISSAFMICIILPIYQFMLQMSLFPEHSVNTTYICKLVCYRQRFFTYALARCIISGFLKDISCMWWLYVMVYKLSSVIRLTLSQATWPKALTFYHIF